MTTGNKTLADVQPGGRVRLGDEAFAQGCDELRMRTDGERAAYLEGVSEGRRAALSAQPSPGGQGQLDVDDLAQAIRKVDGRYLLGAGALAEAILSELPHLAARQPAYVQGCDELRARTEGERAAYMEGLEEGKKIAARQPVGEPVGYLYDWTHSSALGRGDEEFTSFTTDIEVARSSKGGINIRPVYAAPTAQADQEYLESLDRALEGVIDERDRYHEMADDLAGHIAAITGVDIGEHSSANCPWQNAIEAAEEYQPAQAVDLGAVREALQAAEGLATICASVDGYSREGVAASGRAMRQQFADALAKVDSQAVGNG